MKKSSGREGERWKVGRREGVHQGRRATARSGLMSRRLATAAVARLCTKGNYGRVRYGREGREKGNERNRCVARGGASIELTGHRTQDTGANRQRDRTQKSGHSRGTNGWLKAVGIIFLFLEDEVWLLEKR